MTKRKKPEKRIRQGIAKVEYLANKAEIHSLLAKGYSARHVHEMLTEAKKITMSYTRLIGLINIDKNSVMESEQVENANPSLPKPQPQIISSNGSAFNKVRIDITEEKTGD